MQAPEEQSEGASSSPGPCRLEPRAFATVPGTKPWPATLRTTVRLVGEAPDRTRVTVTSEPHGETTSAEFDAFVRERPGMTRGWTGSIDTLEALFDRSGIEA
jgi:hypothetical protein